MTSLPLYPHVGSTPFCGAFAASLGKVFAAPKRLAPLLLLILGLWLGNAPASLAAPAATSPTKPVAMPPAAEGQAAALEPLQIF
ncbi:MAG: hypothetical protein FJX22_02135, partial [Alphaproteobacteria bacterium]|nr:hypothetical protein [Alphaproteobacteria bacterium]